MGTQQVKVENVAEDIKHTTEYSLDFRLIEKFTSLPSYFSSNTQKIIQEIEQLSLKITPHPLENYLIHCIDIRFSKLNRLNMKAVTAGKEGAEALSIDETKFPEKNWFELQTKERFLETVTLLERHYQIECLIQQQYLKADSQSPYKKGAFDSLRKPIRAKSSIAMDEGLIMRLLYHYYIVIIKTYANSGEKHIFKFHQETGRQLCLMILHGYLTLEELYEVFYYIVYIDKHPKEITSRLSIINHLYHSKCLRTYYSINMEKKHLQLLQATARLYLDQLYMNSIREAEDPEIKNTDDALMPIKMFPISRVKDKPRT